MTSTSPKAKRPPRTPKEKAFAKEYILNGGNGTKAALKVYDTDANSARSIASQNLAKLNIVEMMDSVAGLSRTDRLKCLVEGLYATKQLGATTMQRAGENTVDFVDVPDYATRYKYLELTYKLDGSLKQAETVINNTQVNVTPILSGLSTNPDVPSNNGD